MLTLYTILYIIIMICLSDQETWQGTEWNSCVLYVPHDSMHLLIKLCLNWETFVFLIKAWCDRFLKRISSLAINTSENGQYNPLSRRRMFICSHQILLLHGYIFMHNSVIKSLFGLVRVHTISLKVWQNEILIVKGEYLIDKTF